MAGLQFSRGLSSSVHRSGHVQFLSIRSCANLDGVFRYRSYKWISMEIRTGRQIIDLHYQGPAHTVGSKFPDERSSTQNFVNLFWVFLSGKTHVRDILVRDYLARHHFGLMISPAGVNRGSISIGSSSDRRVVRERLSLRN